jgi:hypothetical protein
MLAGNRPHSKGGMNNAEKFYHGAPGKQSTNCFTKRKMTHMEALRFHMRKEMATVHFITTLTRVFLGTILIQRGQITALTGTSGKP